MSQAVLTEALVYVCCLISTGMGTFYVKGKYLPVGEVDWDLVTETFNQNTRSSRFSKKQVKDRWEQHVSLSSVPCRSFRFRLHCLHSSGVCVCMHRPVLTRRPETCDGGASRGSRWINLAKVEMQLVYVCHSRNVRAC